MHEPTCFKRPEGTRIGHIIVKNPRRFKTSINVFCGYSDLHNLVGCIRKLALPPQKPFRVIYKSYKNFNKENLTSDVSQIPFHFCTIFNDVNDHFWAQKVLFTDILNEHAPLREGALKDGHVPLRESEL